MYISHCLNQGYPCNIRVPGILTAARSLHLAFAIALVSCADSTPTWIFLSLFSPFSYFRFPNVFCSVDEVDAKEVQQ